MRTSVTCVLSAVFAFGFIGPDTLADAEVGKPGDSLRVYKVNKKVKDFPEKEDFSTPEAAYAVINRVLARGERGAWRRISVKKIKNRLSPADAKPEEVQPENAKVWLNARILEVRIFREQRAVVLAELSWDPESPRIDKRFVDLENGRWLNTGQDPAAFSLEEARAETNAKFANMFEKPSRPKIDNPEAYLRPFAEFLKNKAQEPKAVVMEALAGHKVVIMGEVHHRPRYWAFNSSLVAEPNFPKYVGTIYMELPPHAQDFVDKFLASEDCDTMPVIEMLRDNLWMGWPDQAMLDFFITVWMVNQNLESQQPIRIVLVDMQRPWKKIKKRQDWAQYERVSRDRQMADNVLRDIRQHPDEKRNTLFIVGVGHTGLNLQYFEDAPVLTAGWYLRKELGPEMVYAIFPHMPVQTNWGRVDGRLCLGLFDSAFAALDNKPMAFPLNVGPFGQEPFDAFPDRPMRCTYRDGYNAYLYLGPLEMEIFSPLIAAFYTDEFVKELNRRSRVMSGKGLVERWGMAKANPESFIKWMSNSWGKPRRSWRRRILGPMNAWHRGGTDWKQPIQEEKLARVMDHPEEVVQAARQLFENIRAADYDAFLTSKKGWDEFPTARYYMAHHWHDKLVEWICKTFKDNPVVSIELGEVFIGDKEIIGKKGWPTVPYKLKQRDGTILEGDLPFEYNFDGGKGHWHGMQGIDWHIQ